ncbi:MAG: hypothetical protein MI810_02225 [Flavobacteriales bacterium]|nr:hypothetical protein [Flavobacteriales bacterium]
MKHIPLLFFLFSPYFIAFSKAFPNPSGPYSIGSKTVYLTDSSRMETLTKNPTDYRQLAIQLYYPIRQTSPNCQQSESVYGKKVNYYHCLNAPLHDSLNQLPIVLLSPGLGGHFLMNATLAEEIASHGYYVINIGHSYFNEVPEFPNGSAPELFGMDTLKMESDNVIGYAFRQVLNQYIKIECEDMKSVIKNLSSFIPENDLEQLNVDNIACMGYSAGGAAAAEICTQKKAIKVGINLNGILYGDAHLHELSQPFLYVNADYSSPKKAEIESLGGMHIIDSLMNFYDQRKASLRKKSSNHFYELTLSHTTHHNFTDLALVNQSFCGKSNPKKSLQITYSFIISFLDTYLKNEPKPLIENEVKSEDYTFEIK